MRRFGYLFWIPLFLVLGMGLWSQAALAARYAHPNGHALESYAGILDLKSEAGSTRRFFKFFPLLSDGSKAVFLYSEDGGDDHWKPQIITSRAVRKQAGVETYIYSGKNSNGEEAMVDVGQGDTIVAIRLIGKTEFSKTATKTETIAGKTRTVTTESKEMVPFDPLRPQ